MDILIVLENNKLIIKNAIITKEDILLELNREDKKVVFLLYNLKYHTRAKNAQNFGF